MGSQTDWLSSFGSATKHTDKKNMKFDAIMKDLG